MSASQTESQRMHHIHQIVPSVKVYYKLNQLLISMPTKDNQQDLIIVAVEYSNQKRYFLSLTFDELSKLLYYLEPCQRTLYEVLCQKKSNKLYFDFGVYIKNSFNLDVQESLLILQNLFHNVIANCVNQDSNNSTSFTDHFLVLSASTELKHSYHLIYTNTSVRFESQETISHIIMVILQHYAHFIVTPSCQQQFPPLVNINHQNDYLVYLQTTLSQTNFCNCAIPKTNITCSNFEKLFYKNQDGSHQWVFDLHVYSKNQQFRLYKSTKFGINNTLLPTSDFNFKRNYSHDETINYNNIYHNYILNHSLISYSSNYKDIIIIPYNQNLWSISNENKNYMIDLSSTDHFNSLILPNTCNYI
ncbi:unnamed protein product, partial [Rotaria magnacalcarata]